MTFGEKLKNARKEAGLSQEKLAEKLSVSRSAVAKWEADNGMPDVNNLKAMAVLLNTSIDYLLDEDEKITFNETIEPIELESFEKTGKCRDKKDAAAYWKYKDADAIYPLIRSKKLSTKEFLLDLVTSWGVSQLADYANNMDGYYLVEKGSKQFLVRVSKDFISSSELANRVDPKKFVIGNNVFKKAAYQLI
ncbi:MAG: helix-turn-helix domain-containing protein [Erysipelotrichaceae bacterium]|nr:helix-turn-helix domain-containing protein [Erysipelotrichaceae bacterium]